MAKTVAKVQTESKPVIAIDETEIKAQLGQLVRASVEETLNGLLEAEADRLCKAPRYQRRAERVDTRAGHYQRQLQTQAGPVKLQVPKLRSLPFETQIIERYRRRESSVEEALLEMYYAGVSMRRVEDITDALWGTRVSPSTISDLNQKLASRIEAWRTRRLTGGYVFVWLDAIWLKRSWGGEVQNVSVLVAIGVNADGLREVVGVQAGEREDHDSWYNFLKTLKERGLTGTELFITDKCLGLVAAVAEVPRSKLKDVVAMLKAIHAQEDREAAQQKAQEVVKKLLAMKLAKAAQVVRDGVAETLAYMSFPREHWLKIRTTNPLERIMREIRRRTRVVGAFPDGNAAVLLVAARLRHIAGTRWGTKQYMDMKRLQPKEDEAA